MNNLLIIAKSSSHIPAKIIWSGSVRNSNNNTSDTSTVLVTDKLSDHNNKKENKHKVVDYCKITAV